MRSTALNSTAAWKLSALTNQPAPIMCEFQSTIGRRLLSEHQPFGEIMALFRSMVRGELALGANVDPFGKSFKIIGNPREFCGVARPQFLTLRERIGRTP